MRSLQPIGSNERYVLVICTGEEVSGLVNGFKSLFIPQFWQESSTGKRLQAML